MVNNSKNSSSCRIVRHRAGFDHNPCPCIFEQENVPDNQIE
jgi:hypothetical protein